MLKTIPDSKLFEAVVHNDQKAFNLLFERHWTKIYAAAFKYLKDQETCLEITHDIFLNIWNKRHELEIRNFKSYVITAASYHAIRKKQNLKAIPLRYVEDYEYAGETEFVISRYADFNDGESRIYTGELNLKVNALLDGLPKRCREIYTMSRKENLSINEIADRLNISRRTVENQLTIALKHLRTSLKYIGIVVLIRIAYLIDAIL